MGLIWNFLQRSPRPVRLIRCSSCVHTNTTLGVASSRITVCPISETASITVYTTQGFEGYPLRKDFPLTARIFTYSYIRVLIVQCTGLHRGQIRRREETCCLRAPSTDSGIPVRHITYSRDWDSVFCQEFRGALSMGAGRRRDRTTETSTVQTPSTTGG